MNQHIIVYFCMERTHMVAVARSSVMRNGFFFEITYVYVLEKDKNF